MLRGKLQAPKSGEAKGIVRFQTLDGLRGVAAVAVVLHHAYLNFKLGGYAPPLAYLSVDLFFCLSGFVISFSYDAKMAAGMSALSFMQKRAIRLAPLALLGWILGIATVGFAKIAHGHSNTYLVTTEALNLVLLPGTASELFPLNAPGWSLFFELWIANLAYGIFWRWLECRMLVAIILGSALGLILFGWHDRTLGMGYNYSTFAGGAARVSFSFCVGILIQRFNVNHPVKLRVPSALLCAGFILLICLPVSGRSGFIYQLVCVVVAFPLIVYVGANAKERHPAVGKSLGDASYAAYTIHWPILCFIAWMFRREDLGNYGATVEVGACLLVVALALLAHHNFDTPSREWMRKRLNRRYQTLAATDAI